MTRDLKAADYAKDIKKLEKLAHMMDSYFAVPGTSIRFGLDSLFGLFPGIGDTGTLLLGLYVIGKAQSHNVPWYVTLRMIWNAFLDWLIGLIPIIGDVFDIGWKSNLRNVSLIKK
jgi:hypothetical protein